MEPNRDDVVLAIIAGVAEGPKQGFMHVAVEHERPASRMQGDLEDSVFSFHPRVFVSVAIVVEHSLTPFVGLPVTGGER